MSLHIDLRLKYERISHFSCVETRGPRFVAVCADIPATLSVDPPYLANQISQLYSPLSSTDSPTAEQLD